MNINKLTIKRSEWARGLNAGKATSLLDEEDNFKCCLGFFALACGLREIEILERAYPCSLLDKSKLEIPQLVDKYGADTNFTVKAARINDHSSISDEEREKQLIELFAENNIELTFVD